MSEHIVPRTTYFAVFGALLVGTAITVFAATIDFGPMNDVIAMTIAVTKMMLVLLFFMHVRYSSRLIWVVVSSMFFWLFILLALTLSDYRSRGLLSPQVHGPGQQEPQRNRQH
jgi:cytochrome c oxidase subunit 4